MDSEDSFARFVSLACHDLRTPLATVGGFAHTLERTEDLGEQGQRFLGMIQAASDQIGDLLDDLGLVTRIQAGRYEPNLVEADTLELAQAAAARAGERASATGTGGLVRVEREAVERALSAWAICALRHGALDQVELAADGDTVSVAPVTAPVAPIMLADDLKDLGAATARRVVEALGGSLALDGERFLIRLPG